MEGELTIFKIVRNILLGLTPIVFISSLSLMFFKEKYDKIENVLSKNYGPLKKKLIPLIENDIYKFHNLLLKRRFLVGLILFIFSILVFISLL